MKFSKPILSAIVVMATIGIFACLLQRSAGPFYQGKPMRYWLQQYKYNHFYDSGGELDRQAQAAIQHIGPGAIPIYLRMMDAKESWFRVKLVSLLSWQWRNRLHVPDNLDYRDEIDTQRELGGSGIAALGPEAQPAIPAIEKLLKDENLAIRENAASVLGALGPVASNAVPSLIECLMDPDSAVRSRAELSLHVIVQHPGQVITIVDPFLDSNDQRLRLTALTALGSFGPAAKPTVPHILKLLNDSDQAVRDCAVNALLAIAPETADKLGVTRDESLPFGSNGR